MEKEKRGLAGLVFPLPPIPSGAYLPCFWQVWETTALKGQVSNPQVQSPRHNQGSLHPTLAEQHGKYGPPESSGRKKGSFAKAPQGRAGPIEVGGLLGKAEAEDVFSPAGVEER